jgi:hypothetical protein
MFSVPLGPRVEGEVLMASFITGQRVQVREGPRRRRCGTIVATLRDDTYLVNLLPQAQANDRSEQAALEGAELEDDYAEVRRYSAERITRLRLRR